MKVTRQRFPVSWIAEVPDYIFHRPVVTGGKARLPLALRQWTMKVKRMPARDLV